MESVSTDCLDDFQGTHSDVRVSIVIKLLRLFVMWIQHLLYVCVFFLCFACGDIGLDAPGPSEYCRGHSDECLDGLRCQLNDDEEYRLPDPSHAEGSFIPDAMVDATPASDCDDGTQNGSETDVDCGGRCTACAHTARCVGSADHSVVSAADAVCQPPRCGDGGDERSEACDDGNTVTEACAYGLAECTVCAADCLSSRATNVCGDGTVDEGEGCDDGNTVTEACAYGLAECTVCAADCTAQAGKTNVCGDGTVVDEGEACMMTAIR